MTNQDFVSFNKNQIMLPQELVKFKNSIVKSEHSQAIEVQLRNLELISLLLEKYFHYT